MAKQDSPKKTRRLKHASETVRERAQNQARPKVKRFARVRSFLAIPFHDIGRLGGLRIWRPFRFAGRLIGKLLVPPYLRSSFRELREVTWPSRMQTLKLTSAVLIFSLVFGTIVAIVDFGLDKLFKQVILR